MCENVIFAGSWTSRQLLANNETSSVKKTTVYYTFIYYEKIHIYFATSFPKETSGSDIQQYNRQLFVLKEVSFSPLYSLFQHYPAPLRTIRKFP